MPATSTARWANIEQAIGHYRARGWAVVEEVFTADEVAAVAEVTMQVSSRELTERPHEPFTADASPDGQVLPRKIDYPFLKHPVFRSFVMDERLARIATAFLGRCGYLIRDQLFCKPPRFGTAKPYHQENAALLFKPASDMLVLWVALDDAAEDNGCLRMIDGSHRSLLDHMPIPDAPYHLVPAGDSVDADSESLVPAAAGSVVVIHSQTLHASSPNHSARWRRAHSSHWVTDRVTCGTDALTWAYSATVGSGKCRYQSP